MHHSSLGRWTAAFLLVSALALGGLGYAVFQRSDEAGPAQSGAASEQEASSGSGAESSAADLSREDDPTQTEEPGDISRPDSPDVSQEPQNPAEPEGPQKPQEPEKPAAPQEPSVPREPVEIPGAEGSSYDFSQPAPQREAVDNSYFDDAAFVGDSRTDGFLIYSGIGTGKNLTSNGLSIFKLDEKKALTIGGEKYTLLEALAMEEYSKVYLSLGVNELGYYDDQGFYDSYCKAIDDIRAIQPNAVVYIQGLIPLNEEVIAQTGGRDYLKNDHLRVYNDLMKKAAQEKNVVFLDLYSEFADETGSLPAEASKDGVHLRGDWCKKWLSYLQTHTVDFDTLYPGGTAQTAEPEVQEPENGSVEP